MTTQPTPEQLAKWRVKFESRYDLSQLGTVYDRYLHQDVREAWGNYVEAREDAKQENEQVMKLAKFGALVLDSKLLMRHNYGTIDRAIEAGVLSGKDEGGRVMKSIFYAAGIQESIQELLK